MYQRHASTRRTRRLSVRISFFLILAAILPLLIALVFSEVQTRATLINQADRTLAADAQTHSQLIENYLTAKLLEVRTLDNTPIVQQYFADPVHNQAALAVVLQMDLLSTSQMIRISYLSHTLILRGITFSTIPFITSSHSHTGST